MIIVEHDEDAIRSADHIIDIGPGAGIHGGRICAEGDVKKIIETKSSITGQYLSGKKKITFSNKKIKPKNHSLK